MLDAKRVKFKVSKLEGLAGRENLKFWTVLEGSTMLLQCRYWQRRGCRSGRRVSSAPGCGLCVHV